MRANIQNLLKRLKNDEVGFASYRAAFQVLTVRCLGAGAAYGSQILLARLMGQSDYGIFALTWIWILIIGHLSPLGFNHSVCRFAAHYHKRGEHALLHGFIRTGILTSVLFAIAASLTGALVLWIQPAWLDDVYLRPLAIALLVIPVFALQDFIEGIARAFNWSVLAIAPAYLIRNIALGVGMFAAVWFGAPATAWVAAAVLFAAVVSVCAVQAIWVFIRLRRLVPAAARQYQLRQWFTTTAPFVLVDGTQLMFTNMDVLVLSLFFDPATIGIYFAASRLTQLVAFVPYAATAATAQRYATLNAVGDAAGIARLAANTTRLSVLLALGIAAAILPLSSFLLGLFGPGFDAAVPVLAILIGGIVIQAFAGPGEDLLNMLGHERACAAVFIGALALNLILNFTLIPAFGITGAALATALSIGARSLILTMLVKTKLNIDILFKLPAKPIDNAPDQVSLPSSGAGS